MSTSLSFKLDDTEFSKTLNHMIDGAKDYTEPLNDAGDDMLDIYGNKVFEQQAANQDPWRELSPATLMMRDKRQGHYAQAPRRTDKILVWTGTLMDGFVKSVDKVKLKIENGVEYFKYHQRSQRKMLFLNKDIITLVLDKVKQHTNDSMK